MEASIDFLKRHLDEGQVVYGKLRARGPQAPRSLEDVMANITTRHQHGLWWQRGH